MKENYCGKQTGERIPRGANRDIGGPGEIGAGWHSRGYLPHFESSEVMQHVTFHLADSLPKAVLQRMDVELRLLPAEKREVEHRKRLEDWIDAGHGCCVLRHVSTAQMVQNTLLSCDGQRYRMLAWVVMPNHVHALLEPMHGWTIAKIVASWKKFTARKICDGWRECQAAGPGAPVWRREYWDRYIRDERHFLRTVEYIHLNPVKAGLAERTENWRWSSAYTGE